ILRGDAVRDALRTANSYVDGLGLKLGRVRDIATQPPEPVAPGFAGMSPRGAPRAAAVAIPVEPSVQTLRTEVEVTWELVQ
ncbi:MAG: SIMPL domain-containing protein, partial [Methylocella sp.]